MEQLPQINIQELAEKIAQLQLEVNFLKESFSENLLSKEVSLLEDFSINDSIDFFEENNL